MNANWESGGINLLFFLVAISLGLSLTYPTSSSDFDENEPGRTHHRESMKHNHTHQTNNSTKHRHKHNNGYKHIGDDDTEQDVQHHVIEPPIGLLENYTEGYPLDPSYADWPEEGDIPCRSMEECEVYFNKSDPLRDAILLNEVDTPTSPCLIQGELTASSNWYGYLANGTLGANGARFYYRIVYPEAKCCIKLLLYLEDQVSALRAHMNCLQRQSIIATNPKQIITLSPSVESSGCTSNHTINGQKMIECNSGRILRSNYDQHWLFAASSCGSPTGLSMEYNLVLYGLRTECPNTVSTSAPAMVLHKLYCILPSALAIYHAMYWLTSGTGNT